MDLGSSGPKFTWRGPIYRGYNRIFKRLDRGLVNSSWQISFPDTSVRVLPRVKSDHHPLLLDTSGFCASNHFHEPFRFMAAWQTHKMFRAFLQDSWPSLESLPYCLESTQSKLRSWHKEVFQSIPKRKRAILARLAGIQRIIPQNRNPFLVRLENELSQELDSILL